MVRDGDAKEITVRVRWSPTSVRVCRVDGDGGMVAGMPVNEEANGLYDTYVWLARTIHRMAFNDGTPVNE